MFFHKHLYMRKWVQIECVKTFLFSSVLDAILRVAVKDAKGRKLFTASIALRDTNLTKKKARKQPKVQIALLQSEHMP